MKVIIIIQSEQTTETHSSADYEIFQFSLKLYIDKSINNN